MRRGGEIPRLSLGAGVGQSYVKSQRLFLIFDNKRILHFIVDKGRGFVIEWT